MKTTEIRQKFIDYFRRNGHRVIPSSSLVPGNDPTLLFTNAGMVQFKDVFLGEEQRDYQRAVTSQRCVRAGGKHNDLENVGFTARHHTFFEMLGNFSFGDYFKEDAIRFAWELLTDEFGLPADKLWVTVFEEDDEAESIWIDQIGVPANRVTRAGAKDNFWQMGDTGPCGPCSEIFYDHGAAVQGGPPGTPEQEGDRYVEIWNLVFMQFNRNADGSLDLLPRPAVDTGMGLERIAAVLQGAHSNYEIDLFVNLIDKIAEILGVEALKSQSLRVIADHIRSTAFLIADGVMPSNEGRGYVLRRIIRRAIRHGHRLGRKAPFMHLLADPLAAEMGEAFPELGEAGDVIKKVLEQENEKFNETLDQGLKILDRKIENLSGRIIPGEVVFNLYDTYGFPVDLTADVAREHNLEIDIRGFEQAMDAQRERARSASHFASNTQKRLKGGEPTPFVGYHNLDCAVKITALLDGDSAVEQIMAGDNGIAVLDQSPFYAESGGQAGDTGTIVFEKGKVRVKDTQYLPNKVIGHVCTVVEGEISVGMTGHAEVARHSRYANANNHSATHLLHAALKKVLGDHVDQKGSLIEPDRLRFDFSHFEPVTEKQITEIESLVNKNIRANHRVAVDIMNLDEAKRRGAAALFGEKYEDRVRVVKMGEFSFELCGGTHVSSTGDIGTFKIISETGTAHGIRRIEALTAEKAEQYIDAQLSVLSSLSSILKTKPDRILDRVNGLIENQKAQQKQIQILQTKLAAGASQDRITKEINGIEVVVLRQDDSKAQSMRITVDQWRSKVQNGVVLVVGANGGKVILIAGVSKNLSGKLHAGDLIQKISPVVGGRGGGRADLAQGGGPDIDKISDATEAAFKWIEHNTVL